MTFQGHDMTETDLKSICARLREIGPSTVGGALDALNIDGLVLPPIRPVAPDRKFAGPAFTVNVAVGALGTFAPEEFDIPAYVDNAAAGDVIAIDAGGAMVSMMGGAAATAAKLRGVSGIVVHGGVRDLAEIVDSGMDLFVQHAVPVSGRTRVRTAATQVPIRLENVVVHPGDILVGDSTGVVCIPRARLQEVYERAEKAEAMDRVIFENVNAGKGLREAARLAKSE
jgi:regulator of RNase E activity RraA